MLISANQLTLLRLLLVPVFVLAITYNLIGAALLAFVSAAITDLLDGLIARKFGQQTALGATLDPVADKLLLAAAFVTLTFPSLNPRIPLWMTITVLSRDVLLVVGALLVNLTLERRVFPPTIWGKATTAMQLLVVTVSLVGNYLSWTPPLYPQLLLLTVGMTVFSGIHYLARGRRFLEKPEPKTEPRP